MEHASTLLGKDVKNVWDESLKNKAKPIRHFLKMKKYVKEKHEEMLQLSTTAKEAASITKDDIPKNMVIFPMLIKHFEENPEYLLKVIKVSKACIDSYIFNYCNGIPKSMLNETCIISFIFSRLTLKIMTQQKMLSPPTLPL